MINIDIKNMILESFYMKHQKPSIIAKELNVRPSYITKIIQKDKRYTLEKESQKSNNAQNRKIKNRLSMQKKREKERELLDDMKLKHRQDVIELSYHTL